MAMVACMHSLSHETWPCLCGLTTLYPTANVRKYRTGQEEKSGDDIYCLVCLGVRVRQGWFFAAKEWILLKMLQGA
jgi:hypothetical protein